MIIFPSWHGLKNSRGDLPEMRPMLFAPVHFLPDRSIPEHCEGANSPPDCYAPSPFARSSSRISLPGGTDIHTLDPASGIFLPGKSQDHKSPAADRLSF